MNPLGLFEAAFQATADGVASIFGRKKKETRRERIWSWVWYWILLLLMCTAFVLGVYDLYFRK
jgi:hypothetical protein